MFGLDEGQYAGLKRRLDDRSRANQLNLYSPFINATPQLAALLSEVDPRRRQWLETFRWYAGAAKQMQAFDGLMVSSFGYPVPYAVSQLNGAYFEVSDMLATQHTIETAADCEAYLSRLAALAVVIDQDTAVSKAQATAGTVPPDYICDCKFARNNDPLRGGYRV